MRHIKTFNESNSIDYIKDIILVYLEELEDELNYEGNPIETNLSSSNCNYHCSCNKEKLSLRLISSKEMVDKTIKILKHMESDLKNNRIEFKSNLYNPIDLGYPDKKSFGCRVGIEGKNRWRDYRLEITI